MYSIRNDSDFEINRHRDLLVQSNEKGWRVRVYGNTTRQKNWFRTGIWFAIVLLRIR